MCGITAPCRGPFAGAAAPVTPTGGGSVAVAQRPVQGPLASPTQAAQGVGQLLAPTFGGGVVVAPANVAPTTGARRERSAGAGAPTSATTGVPAGTVLRSIGPNQEVPGTGGLRTDAKGDLTITTPGVVLDGIDLHGQVKVQAANVTIRNSRIRGPQDGGTHNTGLIDANHAAVRNLVVEDTLLTPDHPSYWLDGIIGHDFTARRIDVHDVVDGFGVYNNTGDKRDANVLIEDSYIHDLSWYAKDEDHTNGTHNDGIQVQGGANVTIRGNNIQGYLSTRSGDVGHPNYDRRRVQDILVQRNVSKISNIVIEDNLLDGGSVGIYLRGGTGSSEGESYTVRNNRFGTDQRDFGNGSRYQIRIQDRTIAVPGLASNVWAASGSALAEGRNSGIRYDA